MTETIELRLRTIKQLFQSLDPAPFHDQDLDPDAVAYGYFAWREELAWRDLRLRLAEGRQSLAIGLMFLGACTLARELLQATTDSPWLAWIEEGLTIVGWIAMWHPIDTFLYRWWPIRREARLNARLARMRVTPRLFAPPP
jgi:hypothetical protein